MNHDCASNHCITHNYFQQRLHLGKNLCTIRGPILVSFIKELGGGGGVLPLGLGRESVNHHIITVKSQ